MEYEDFKRNCVRYEIVGHWCEKGKQCCTKPSKIRKVCVFYRKVNIKPKN